VIQRNLLVRDWQTKVVETKLARGWTAVKVVMRVDLAVDFVCPCARRKVDRPKLESLRKCFAFSERDKLR
jgi:hypothetical protein